MDNRASAKIQNDAPPRRYFRLRSRDAGERPFAQDESCIALVVRICAREQTYDNSALVGLEKVWRGEGTSELWSGMILMPERAL